MLNYSLNKFKLNLIEKQVITREEVFLLLIFFSDPVSRILF